LNLWSLWHRLSKSLSKHVLFVMVVNVIAYRVKSSPTFVCPRSPGKHTVMSQFGKLRLFRAEGCQPCLDFRSCPLLYLTYPSVRVIVVLWRGTRTKIHLFIPMSGISWVSCICALEARCSTKRFAEPGSTWSLRRLLQPNAHLEIG
jgi:hypothetical protein